MRGFLNVCEKIFRFVVKHEVALDNNGDAILEAAPRDKKST